ncbi:MAG: hypothetical protein FJZ01_23795 [Candidatus Sericytochromatia bacterium]|nr:hypothetical protein [Candidatus Tanganyikabacteria bacterium]
MVVGRIRLLALAIAGATMLSGCPELTATSTASSVRRPATKAQTASPGSAAAPGLAGVTQAGADSTRSAQGSAKAQGKSGPGKQSVTPAHPAIGGRFPEPSIYSVFGSGADRPTASATPTPQRAPDEAWGGISADPEATSDAPAPSPTPSPAATLPPGSTFAMGGAF